MKITLTIEIEAGSAHGPAFYLSGALREIATKLTDRHQANIDGLPTTYLLLDGKARLRVTG